MSGENRAAFTADDENPKCRFRAVFVALHGSAKRYPGGISALAAELGVSAVGLADRLHPDHLDKMPSLREFLGVYERSRSASAANSFALVVDRTTVPVMTGEAAPAVMAAFVDLARRASEAVAGVAEGLADGRLDADERARLAPLFDDLIAVGVAFRRGFLEG